MEYHRSVCSAQDANANVSKIWNISALASIACGSSTAVFLRRRLEVVVTAVNAPEWRRCVYDAPNTVSCVVCFKPVDVPCGSSLPKSLLQSSNNASNDERIFSYFCVCKKSSVRQARNSLQQNWTKGHCVVTAFQIDVLACGRNGATTDKLFPGVLFEFSHEYLLVLANEQCQATAFSNFVTN